MNISVKKKKKLTENWFAKTGLSSHNLGKSCQRKNSPLYVLPMLPALPDLFFQIKWPKEKVVIINLSYKSLLSLPNTT